jgi:hypothetical protein
MQLTEIALRRSSGEGTLLMESICDYDDTLPLPDAVEREFLDKAGDDLTALAWLEERDIDSAPVLKTVGKIALIQYCNIWNPETNRYRLLIYEPDHVGPKYPPELAIPIIEKGVFVDLLFISDDMSYTRTTCRTPWLGRENLLLPIIRLHSHPMDWLEAGCKGVCHIEPISRKALAELTDATTIECNDVYTALEAWDWAFGGDYDELARFSIDDSPASIRLYFEDEAKWRTAYLARDLS